MFQPLIAIALETNIEKLIQEWSRAVRDDPRIESDANLSDPELIDHVPAMIEEICELIRKRETPSVRNSHELRVNVYIRFWQGYKGRDLVRELSLLRMTLLEFLLDISSNTSFGIEPEDSYQAAAIMNLYLDEEMRYAISVFGSAAAEPQAV
jgi:hypothetical protein